LEQEKERYGDELAKSAARHKECIDEIKLKNSLI